MATGHSLHIGVSTVDFTRYREGFTASGADAVAARMAAVAGGRGLRATTLVNEQATRDRVSLVWRSVASGLKANDLFVVTVAAHGVPRRDAADCGERLGQGLVLYDGYWLDDEIYALLKEIAVAARVVVVVDSCHAGSMLTNLQNFKTAGAELAQVHGASSRIIPELHRQKLYECRDRVTANILLLAASGDRQVAIGGVRGGMPPFSSAFLGVLDDSKDYRDLQRRISGEVSTLGAPAPVLNDHLITDATLLDERPLKI